MSDELLKNEVITYKSIADTLGYTETVIRNVVTKSIKEPDVRLRRAVHIFFNKDYYKELGEFSGVSDVCKAKCQFPYYMDVVKCGIHSKKN